MRSPSKHEQFQVAIVPVDSDSTLRHGFGDLAPVAVVLVLVRPDRCCRGPGTARQVLPRSSPARAGTSLWKRGTGPRCSGPPPTSAPRASTWRDCRTPRPIGTAAAGGPAPPEHDGERHRQDFDPGLDRAFAVLITVSAVVMSRGYRLPGMTLLDALYVSTETVATVGCRTAEQTSTSLIRTHGCGTGRSS